ncbi:MAG: patatin-like phospholipase family protein [Phaeodactylibacter sp.]|nr:patatin-like phospholipase family protein [Phaeodactylibacter sp.]MCB9053026.1 patatin-like phospholipase family protein [Lewinellaceae bacterium]
MKRWFHNLYYSFPVQLLVVHLRSNLLLIGLWILFALLFSGSLGRKYGFQYLFLDPEYLGQVNFWSFFFVGLAFGSFFMSWNLTLYLLTSHYFPFLASLSRPFTKFVINNMVLPLCFFLFYMAFVFHFQRYYESLSVGVILMNCLGFLVGSITLVSFYSLYFQFTNRDISYYERPGFNPPNLSFAPGRRQVDVEYIKLDTSRWKVATYLSESLQPRLVRSVAHYDSSLLMSIFKQNHLNALILQLLSMMVLLALGYLIDYSPFRIPAGASLFILASVLTAVIGAVTYWFNEWRATVILVALVAINFITRSEPFNHQNRAYGMDYQAPPAAYTVEKIQGICSDPQIEKDKNATIAILNRWRQKVAPAGFPKPQMVVLSVSGGGLKAASWAMKVVQTADSLTQGRLLGQTTLMTGASGGMLGMAYLRELYLRQQLGQPVPLYSRQYIDNITKDLLNSVAFTIVSNDLFLPWATFETGGYTYHKDRGYIFEQQLNENTGFILDKAVRDYREAEQAAVIPMLFLTPSIVNDARRLIISPQGVSYMMAPPAGQYLPNTVEADAVDFGWMFKGQNADNLRFLTGLRMNATYPYILPNVHLPSQPEIEIMDAGFIDNYGMISATRFIQVFQDWIRENTSGVVLLQISSSEKLEQVAPSGGQGIIESLINPLGIAGKVLERQEFEHDNTVGFIYDILGKEHFNVIRFMYRPSRSNKLEASISFHITEREKEDVLSAIQLEENKASLRQLVQLISAPVKQNAAHRHLDE